jgi:hypothetical protein
MGTSTWEGRPTLEYYCACTVRWRVAELRALLPICTPGARGGNSEVRHRILFTGANLTLRPPREALAPLLPPVCLPHGIHGIRIVPRAHKTIFIMWPGDDFLYRPRRTSLDVLALE